MVTDPHHPVGSPAAELGSDVHVLDDTLPDEAERRSAIERLLADYQVLIKDCVGKPGFGDGQFVRLSIRDQADNDYLLGALRSL